MKNFNKDLDFGKIGEDLFEKSNVWKIYFPSEDILIPLEKQEEQNYKGDFKTSPSNYLLEIKTRKPSYSFWCGKDIVIEIDNIDDNGNILFDAWIDKYSENTYLFYQWTELINNEIKEMKPVIVFKPKDLKNHLSWLKSYELKKSNNKGYITRFIVIKLNDLKQKIEVKEIWTEKN